MSTIRNAKTRADVISAMNDENLDNTIRRKFNELSEQFECVILSAWQQDYRDAGVRQRKIENSDDVVYTVRIRSYDEADSCRPDPYAPNLTTDQICTRIHTHRLGLWIDGTGDNETHGSPKFGEVWLARYAGKNYLPPIILTRKLRFDNRIINPKQSLYGGGGGGRRNNNNGGGSAKGDQNEHNIAPIDQVTIVANHANWVKIGETITDALLVIQSAESAGNGAITGPVDPYNNYNMWPQPPPPTPGYPKCAFNPKYHTNKTITKTSPTYVLELGSDTTAYKERIFAVGAYQFVPKSMRRLLAADWMKETYVINQTNRSYTRQWSGSPWTKSQQDAAGAWKAMGDFEKMHPKTCAILGGYFTGLHENHEVAAHVAAKIWAGLPAQFPQINIFGTQISRGMSYYDGVGGNGAHIEPEKVVAAFKTARTAMLAKLNSNEITLIAPSL